MSLPVVIGAKKMAQSGTLAGNSPLTPANGTKRMIRPLRPLHTSAVIFAFGGNALIATSFYVVQRTCRARLAGGGPRLVRVLGLPAVHRAGGTGYLLGITQGKEYAEPEWYVDLWLTVVWVAYLLVFLGTL
jgi:cytochrome c oxidase cbb3-type subunit 1